LPHHDQQASDDQNQTQHGRMLPSNMLLLNLIPLINVTFSTPTSVYAHNHSVMSEIAMFQQELQDGSSWRLLFADEFRLILAVFRIARSSAN